VAHVIGAAQARQAHIVFILNRERQHRQHYGLGPAQPSAPQIFHICHEAGGAESCAANTTRGRPPEFAQVASAADRLRSRAASLARSRIPRLVLECRPVGAFRLDVGRHPAQAGRSCAASARSAAFI